MPASHDRINPKSGHEQTHNIAGAATRLQGRALGSRVTEAVSRPGSSAPYSPPVTTSRPDLIVDGTDEGFREVIYQMVLGLQHLFSCREIFGRHLRLTGSQFAVLMGVAYTQKTDGVSIQDLADHVRLAQPHVTTEVGRLLGKGLLAKRANPGDQRSVLVSLSTRGRAVVEGVVPLVRQVNDLLFDGIKKKELMTVMRVMRQLTFNYEHAVAPIRAEALKKDRQRRRGQMDGRARKTAASQS
jgi:MarR family transcriptional regulator, organic hydroperoxide resistance regulator